MKNYFILLFSISFSLQIVATHNRAGEILYKRIAPFTNVVNSVTVQVYTYSITVIKYVNHGVNVADRCVDTVYFGDGQKGIAPRINGTFTCNCGTNGCGTMLVTNPNYMVKQNVYSITHTYAGPGSYVISSSDPNRNGGVHNIPNSVNVPFILEAGLVINANTGANSSPEFNFAPIDQALLNVCFTHNPGAVDIDGDSLSFEAIPCIAAGYFDPEGSYSVNSLTGLMTWCSPHYLDEYNVAFRVKEWRKNSSGNYVLIGWIMRDMQILVKYGSVGIAKKDLENGISIFPNPASDNVQLTFSTHMKEETECRIYNMDGKLVLTQKINSNTTTAVLDISSLKSGVYNLQVNQNDEVLRRKLIKN